MKKINFFLVIIIFIITNSNIFSQQNSSYNIKYENFVISKEGEKVTSNLMVNLDSVELKSKEMILITPFFSSVDSASKYTEEFSPIAIAGNRRYKALRRSKKLGRDMCETSKDPIMTLRHKRKDNEHIFLTMETVYKPWMRNATAAVYEEETGCACKKSGVDKLVIDSLLPPEYTPSYALTYVTPPAEPVKQRSETYNARLNFKVNKWDLLPEYEDNAEILREVDQIISEIRKDTNLTVTKFSIIGYASPEGPLKNNIMLSENRAKVFVKYLQDKYKIDPSLIDVQWKGEDWDGLKREIMAANDIPDRDEILRLFDTESDTEVIKEKLKKMSNGSTYKILLDKYLPPLRRNEYTIAYVTKPFNIEEAKNMIKIKPHYLSQNEMFLVANTYPKDSEEFKEIFDIAVRIYPDNDIAQLNAAALEIENGLHEKALSRLQKIDMPEAWNNMAIIHCHKKEYEKAKDYFTKAADAGLEEAQLNHDELSKLLADI